MLLCSLLTPPLLLGDPPPQIQIKDMQFSKSLKRYFDQLHSHSSPELVSRDALLADQRVVGDFAGALSFL